MPGVGNRSSCIGNSKSDMRQAPVLNSHTVHTAAQEVAALVLAHAMLAQQRMKAASESGNDVLRISFDKTLVLIRSLWVTLAAGKGIISQKQAGRSPAACSICSLKPSRPSDANDLAHERCDNPSAAGPDSPKTPIPSAKPNTKS